MAEMSLVAVLLVSCTAIGEAPTLATESPVAAVQATAQPTAKPQRIPPGYGRVGHISLD